MIRYLLDRDVMSQLDQPEMNRHANVRAWLATVPDSALHVSAITVVEAWKGLAAARKRASGDPDRLRDQERFELALDTLLASLADRIMPIDGPVAKQWGKLLGHQDKNRFDLCIAATAAVNGMVVATRNTKDFRRRGVRFLDPSGNSRGSRRSEIRNRQRCSHIIRRRCR